MSPDAAPPPSSGTSQIIISTDRLSTGYYERVGGEVVRREFMVISHLSNGLTIVRDPRFPRSSVSLG